MDKRWIIPNIGKLELLYLESQLAEQDRTQRKTDNTQMTDLPWLNPNPELNHTKSPESSANSIATDLDIKQYCRAIDLPGFEDNISPGEDQVI